MDDRLTVVVGDTSVSVVHADLADQRVDAVVNAANEHLVHGGGVAAALVRAGGRVVQEESAAWVASHGPVLPGQAAITTAGAMPARHVIHVVGPRYTEGVDNAAMLRAAVLAALDAAVAAGDHSVALPAISAGIFGYPRAEATAIIVAAVAEWIEAHPGGLSEVRLVGYDADTADDFATSAAALPNAPPSA